jgi:formate dehydrogenase major subunit
MVEAMKKLDLLVVVDPYPSATAAMAAMVRKDGVYLLPAATQFETTGSCTASNRSLQWRERVITPLFDSQTDHAIMYAFAKKFGYGPEFVKNYKIVKPDGDRKMEEPEMESVLREINRATWTIGYTGQSPERLKLHMKHMNTFNLRTLRAKGGPCDGDYFGLPWPCYGTPEIKHPGSPNLYMTSRAMMDGGGCFRANFGIERDGVSLLAEDGSFPKDRRAHVGLPRVRPRADEEARLVGRAHRGREEGGRGQELEDRPVGRDAARHHEARRAPVGQREGARGRLELPRRHPAAPRAAVLAASGHGRQVPDARRQEGVLAPADALQVGAGEEQGHLEGVPAGPDVGRLVEFEGGGEETRSNPWLAELQQENFIEINPRTRTTAASATASTCGRRRRPARRSRSRRWSPSGWVRGRRSSRSTSRAGGRVATCSSSIPEGAAPIVRAEAVNTATTYGYDSVTMMQETKTTLCQVVKA